jgi:hypothetical protein
MVLPAVTLTKMATTVVVIFILECTYTIELPSVINLRPSNAPTLIERFSRIYNPYHVSEHRRVIYRNPRPVEKNGPMVFTPNS